jgi:hypothetical protein
MSVDRSVENKAVVGESVKGSRGSDALNVTPPQSVQALITSQTGGAAQGSDPVNIED